jgi:hypothetical protein
MLMLTYAEAESALAAIYQASGKPQAGAFRGRLKHFKRLGIPLGVNPGRGKKIGYGRNELYQWCFCLELSEFGVDPSIIVKIVRQYWDTQIFPGLNAIKEELNTDKQYYFWIPTELMSASWSPAKQFRGIGYPGIGLGLLQDVPLKWPEGLKWPQPKRRRDGRHNSGLSALTKPASRLSIFNVTDRIRQIENAFLVKAKAALAHANTGGQK